MSEQDIISKYFSRHIAGEYVDIGVGDDAAVVTPPSGSKLLITTDTLNIGVHFDEKWMPDCIAYKALAVSLSDIAAMGAKPLWATINLSLTNIDHSWLKSFSNELYNLADNYSIKVIGGDLVKGPLSITVQVIGSSKNKILTRSNAKIGDLIFVTGTIGDAAYGLKLHESKTRQNISTKENEYFLSRLYKPQPRINLGEKISSFANSAIDISDGLLIDLGRILTNSDVGAVIDIESIPLSVPIQNAIDIKNEWNEIITGGEDFELLFTANESYRDEIIKISKKEKCSITKIGRINTESRIKILQHGKLVPLPQKIGFDHFW